MDQQEASNKNEIPDSVQLNEPVSGQEATDENEQVKGKLEEFGESNLEQFIVKMQSDSVYSRQVLRKLLGLDADKQLVLGKTSGAPQEHNITGTLVHTEHPPKLKHSLPMKQEAAEAAEADANEDTAGVDATTV